MGRYEQLLQDWSKKMEKNENSTKRRFVFICMMELDI